MKLILTTDDLVLHDTKDLHPYIASKNTPNWFKNLKKDAVTPRNLMDNGHSAFDGKSLRSCPAFVQLLRTAVVFPAWSDYLIEVHPDGNWRWRSPDSNYRIEAHEEIQSDGFMPNHVKLKFVNPWLGQTDKHCFGFWGQPQFHNENRFEVVNGCFDLYQFNMYLNINVGFPIPSPSEGVRLIEIYRGQPLCYVHLMTTEKVEVETRYAPYEPRRGFFSFNRRK